MDATHSDFSGYIKLKTEKGLLLLTSNEYKNALKRGKSIFWNRQLSRMRKKNLRDRLYGISPD